MTTRDKQMKRLADKLIERGWAKQEDGSWWHFALDYDLTLEVTKSNVVLRMMPRNSVDIFGVNIAATRVVHLPTANPDLMTAVLLKVDRCRADISTAIADVIAGKINDVSA